MSTPRIVIGAGRPNRLPALVAEYTIKKYCPHAVVVHTWQTPFIQGVDPTIHRDRWESPCEWIPTGHPMGTMFSFCRIMVPEICGFKGRAIYIDADMIVFDTFEKVWDLPMNGAWVQRLPGQFAVCKMDNKALAPYTIGRLLREGKFTYGQILQCRHIPAKRVKSDIPAVWNSCDKMYPGTKLLHYTYMPTQPWVKPGHRCGDVWFDQLAEAVSSGAIPLSTVEEEVRKQDLGKTWQAACYPQPHVLDELDRRL